MHAAITYTLHRKGFFSTERSMMLRLQSNGVRRLLFFKFLHNNFSTTAAFGNPKSHYLVDYLVRALDFSTEEALSAAKKLRPLKSSPKQKPKDPDLVLNFLQNLGLNKAQIKSMVSTDPRLLCCNVDKTLQPKIRALKNLGLSGSDLIRILMKYKSLLCRSGTIASIEYLRKLLGSNEKAASAVKKFAALLDYWTPKRMAPNVLLLKRAGFSDEKVSRFILEYPRHAMQKPEWLEEKLYRVENGFGISRKSNMFYRGVHLVCSLSQSTIDLKFAILRSFWWSDSNIRRLLRNMPHALSISEAKLKEKLNFFMGEIGYTAEYMASRPCLFTLSLDGRVKPRSEVFKILNDKKLSKSKNSLYTVLCLTEAKFLEDYVLPYKDELPDIYNSYIKSVRR